MTIREFFEQQGAQSVLADSIGVTRQNINLWHSGKSKISVQAAMNLAKALNDLGVVTTVPEVIMYFNEKYLEREQAEET